MNKNIKTYPSPLRCSVASTSARIQSLVDQRLRRLARSASLCATVLLFSGIAIPTAKAATGTLNSLPNDAQANSNLAVTSGTTKFGRLGADAGVRNSVVHVFQIPSSILNDPSQQFSAATYTTKVGTVATTVNGDLYGVGYSNSPTVLGSDFYEGALDPNTANTLIQENFYTPATPSYTTVSASNAALVGYLNSALTAARSDGISSAYVFLRLNSDAYVWSGLCAVGMSEAQSPYPPTLSYTTVSVPFWSTVPLGGGGYVTGLVSDPTGADIYCRTDVGGAFKWDGINGKWNSITDLIVSSTNTNSNDLMSIPGIAVDPSNSNNIYVAAGGYTYSPLHGIFASNDKGATWKQINSTIVMHGNGGYRPFGERLQVDPNNSNILWFGSTQDGLQKGVLSGTTWTWTQVPSTSVPFGQVPVQTPALDKGGVTFVACDKNGGNTIVYAGVYDSVGSGTTGGIYMTTDGTNWGKVGGISMTKPARGQVAPNGTLYVTQSGTVGKLLSGGTLEAITPLAGVTYRGLAVDPNDATGNTLYVAETSSGQNNRIWRSVTGGTGSSPWVVQSANYNDLNYARTEPDGTPCVTGYWFGSVSSLMINPANSNELWTGDFFGVSRTQNAQNLGTTNGAFWYLLQKNQEETCVECLLNAPTGPRLMLGQGDVGGYRYLDTSVRPTGTGGSTFSSPGPGSTCGLDFSESDNNVWARTWLYGDQNTGTGAVSRDGGVTWMPFGVLDRKTVVNSGTSGWEAWDVGTYVAQQKAKGANSVTVVLSTGSTIPNGTNTLVFNSREAADTAVRPVMTVNGTTNLTSIADSFVYGSTATTNYGVNTTLSLSCYYNIDTYTRRIYLKFDLSSVGPITSATLQLNRVAAGNTTKFPVSVVACPNTTWVEGDGGTDNVPAGEITWNNKPSLPAGNVYGDVSLSYNDGTSYLKGGRIAISSTDSNTMVWLPLTAIPPRYSKDRGATWTTGTGAPNSQWLARDNPSKIINQLASDRVNGKFYMVKFSGAGSGNHLVYSSTNGGVNWAVTGTCAAGTYNVYRAQMVAAPVANDVWISDDGVSNPAVGGVWRSTDGGASWSKKGSGVISGVRQVAFGKGKPASGYNYSVFVHGYKSGIKGIYRSDDYGATWAALNVLPTGCDINAVAGDRQNYGTVFFGTGGRGVYQGQ